MDVRRLRGGLAAALGIFVLACAPVGGPSAHPAHAAEKEDSALSVRPEVGKPLNEAQALLRTHKAKAALAKLAEIDAVKDKTGFETQVLEQTRLIAASMADDPAAAAKSYAVLEQTGLAPDKRATFLRAVATAWFRAGKYPEAAAWTERVLDAGGTDPQIRAMLPMAYFQAKNYGAALKSADAEIAAIERETRKPAPESLYQIRLNGAAQVHDLAAYDAALERLAETYPQPRYLAMWLARAVREKGFSRRLDLDVLRLKAEIGEAGPDDLAALVEGAMSAGLPGEAAAVAEAGFAKGSLGRGDGAARHSRLRDAAKKAADKDRRELDAAIAEARANPTGIGLVNTGIDVTGLGEAERGVALIREGIARGGLSHPDEATLHLGIALIRADDRAKAAEALRPLARSGAEGTQTLARIWLARLKLKD